MKVTKPFVAKIGPSDMPWMAWLPPTGPDCYEGDAIKAPWGESFWPSHGEACNFLRRCLREATLRDFAHALAETYLVEAQAAGVIGDDDWLVSRDGNYYLVDFGDGRGVVEYTAAEIVAKRQEAVS